jgi:hypothetical protein
MSSEGKDVNKPERMLRVPRIRSLVNWHSWFGALDFGTETLAPLALLARLRIAIAVVLRGVLSGGGDRLCLPWRDLSFENVHCLLRILQEFARLVPRQG